MKGLVLQRRSEKPSQAYICDSSNELDQHQQALQAQFSGDTTENFNNGYIEYVINNREQSESLSTTTRQSASIVAEEISIVGANIFRGNGSSSQAIGAIDSSLDGTNGTLRINLLDPGSFANGSFEASS